MATTFVPELKQVAQLYKLMLKEQDARVMADLARAYSNVYGVARRELDLLIRKINIKLALGQSITPGWLVREGRLLRLQVQIGGELDKFAGDVLRRLQTAQQDAAESAMNFAQQAAHGALGPVPVGGQFSQFWTQLDQAAIQAILANTSPGGPVYRVLQDFAPAGASEARDVIVNGVAQGYNPRKIARELRQSLDVSLTRAQTITRTEVMRVQREVAQQSYQANQDIVSGWVWSSAMDENTCEDCWALEGEFFETEQEPDAHINCRCTLVPEVK